MMRVHVSISEQRLRLLDDGGSEIACYPVSSAANGLGFELGSYRTPTGNFEIREKIGGGEPLGTIFRGREVTGVWDGGADDGDMILTRILRLDGMDPENSNSMERYIYIHGTNHERLLGQPASCGCIRMGNGDIADLYERVPEGTRVVIAP